MIIPTGTDAPIYHWPAATVGLIALNVAAFIVAPPDSSLFETYALALGSGLHPIQWVTSNFLHVGIGHLIGNMIFLWAFGIVVEGKLGFLKFLVVYLLIGTVESAISQVLFLGLEEPSGSVGASAIIFGLMAICLVWAPRNELNCIVIFAFGIRIRVFHWDLHFTTVALLYVAQEIVFLILSKAVGLGIVTQLSHLTGALLGGLLAVIMVKTNLVDCEGWDVFSLWTKNKRLAKDWKKRGETLDRRKKSERQLHKQRVDTTVDRSPEERAASALRKVHQLLDLGDLAGAVAAYDKSARTLVRWPSQPDLLDLIKALHAQKGEVESIPLMRDYCRYYPGTAPKVQLKLAQVLIRDRQRPTAALRVLAEIVPGTLPPDLDAFREKLTRQATQMQEDGVLELEGDD